MILTEMRNINKQRFSIPGKIMSSPVHRINLKESWKTPEGTNPISLILEIRK